MLHQAKTPRGVVHRSRRRLQSSPAQDRLSAGAAVAPSGPRLLLSRSGSVGRSDSVPAQTIAPNALREIARVRSWYRFLTHSTPYFTIPLCLPPHSLNLSMGYGQREIKITPYGRTRALGQRTP